jgi:hypothetical protein
MTIVMPDRDHDLLEVVHAIHDDLELPEGYRAEVIGGQITVAASPFGMHAFIVAEIRKAMLGNLPAATACSRTSRSRNRTATAISRTRGRGRRT